MCPVFHNGYEYTEPHYMKMGPTESPPQSEQLFQIVMMTPGEIGSIKGGASGTSKVL